MEVSFDLGNRDVGSDLQRDHYFVGAKMSRRLTPWGHSGSQPSAALDNYAPSDSILISASPSLESREITHALRDVVAVGFAFLFVSSVGIGFAFSLFCVLFVRF